MKALLPLGMCLTLAVMSARTFAEELQWRPAKAHGATGTAAPSIAATPVQVPATQSVATPVAFRPFAPPAATVVRFKNEDTSQPMPVGPSPRLGSVANSTTTMRVAQPVLQTEPPTVVETQVPHEVIPTRPKVYHAQTPSVVYGPSHGGQIIEGDGGLVLGHGHCGAGHCGAGCDAFGCGCDDDCCYGCYERPHCWVSGEFLLWHFNRPSMPTLLITAPQGTPAGAVVIGNPRVSAVFDEDELRNEIHSGARLSAGFWFKKCPDWGADVGAFFLGRRTDTFFIASNGNPILATPLINDPTGLPGNILVAFPGIVSGSYRIAYSSELWGGEANVRRKLACDCRYHLDLFGGARYIQFEDKLSILDVEFNEPTGPLFVVNESFAARNRFYGGQIGLDGEFRLGKRCFVGARGKVAMGMMNQSITINGTTDTIVPPNPTVTSPGGVLTQKSNIGTFSRDRFAVVPEVNLKVGLDVTDHLRLWVGYDFFYMSSLLRAPEQIDQRVDIAQVGQGTAYSASRPAVLFKTSDFWAHGVNFGLEFRY